MILGPLLGWSGLNIWPGVEHRTFNGCGGLSNHPTHERVHWHTA
jgi:hypothetical protein